MGSNTAFTYGENAMIKVIADPGSVRVKMCPAIATPAQGTVYDEVEYAVSMDLFEREQVNRLIRDLRYMRDRVFGKDE